MQESFHEVSFPTASCAQALDEFRSLWRNEIELNSGNGKRTIRIRRPSEGLARSPSDQNIVDNESKRLYLVGAQLEEEGRVFDAMLFYRRAVQLCPDIEFRMRDALSSESAESFSVAANNVERRRTESESSVEVSNVLDVTAKFQDLRINGEKLCQFETTPTGRHFADMPVELVLLIFRWVAASVLDMSSLEVLSLVCRGFYVCARDEDIWRIACRNLWGVGCSLGTRYITWRDMYIRKPHLLYTGCYISEMSYLRQGEVNMSEFYKPYHIVRYYRYFRFFPDGYVIMLTTPDEPSLVVSKLKSKSCRIQGLLYGYYRTNGSKVSALLKRKKTAEPLIAFYGRHRAAAAAAARGQQQDSNSSDQLFDVELEIHRAGKRRHAKLVWIRYSVHTKYARTGEENVVNFELSANNYPPLFFSRVRSYVSSVDMPME